MHGNVVCDSLLQQNKFTSMRHTECTKWFPLTPKNLKSPSGAVSSAELLIPLLISAMKVLYRTTPIYLHPLHHLPHHHLQTNFLFPRHQTTCTSTVLSFEDLLFFISNILYFLLFFSRRETIWCK
jgi:hypothetical protein